jgi:hypothetical protein
MEKDQMTDDPKDPKKDLTVKSNYVARYQDTRDPFAAFAGEGGPGSRGITLTCKQGVWATGRDDTLLEPRKRFLALPSETIRGWLKWRDNSVVDVALGWVRDGYVPPPRYALGDTDPAEWETDDKGQPKDPWSKCFRMLMIELSAPHAEYEFSASSWGAQLALQDLCGRYSAEKPGAELYPVVDLTTKVRPNKKHGGNIIGPWFAVIGWATIEDVKAGRKAGAGTAKPAAPVEAPMPTAAPKPARKAKAKPASDAGTAQPAAWGKANND